MRSEFQVHMLNEEGIKRAIKIAETFEKCLNEIEELCFSGGREMSIVRTKLEEASFFAKKAMASNNLYQKESK